jgi:metal-responsive CopG/Arc/MetJ family transcriptional regulator
MQMKRFVIFQEDSTIIKTIDHLTKDRGTNRSVFIRQAIRDKLRQFEED